MFFCCELSILPGKNASKKFIALIYWAAMNRHENAAARFAAFLGKEYAGLLSRAFGACDCAFRWIVKRHCDGPTPAGFAPDGFTKKEMA